MLVTDMGYDGPSIHSFFQAVRTTEGLFSSVGTDVCGQGGLAGGAVTAVGALVRFLPGVFLVVDFPISRRLRLVCANITLVQFLRRCQET